MQDGLYVALSSHVALQHRLETIADNIANSNTVGFRATQIRFEELLSGASSTDTSFVSEGTTYLSPRKGGTVETGNPLDFATQGDVWFGIDTPAGMVVTKDGRFKMTPDGELVTLEGYPVVDPGGAPIQLDPKAGPPVAGSDGFLVQNGKQVGAIGLFEYTPGPDFERFGNSGLIPGSPPDPAVDRSDVGVIQGFVEQSNVNPIEEMSRLITVQRTFEGVAALMQSSGSSLEEAIRLIGGQ